MMQCKNGRKCSHVLHMVSNLSR